MDKHLCIHGHFYQPPREDPWLRTVLPEGSAAPGLNWNERIFRESYAPLAWARLLGEDGRIQRIVNVYEYISFNFGPTLFSWMQHNVPETYERILDADRAARNRIGFGGALAQICHHVIMPLASDDDKKIEVAWAVQDFESRFGHLPDGMWLSETAVDTPTLEVLAEAGIAFTILAPRQARAIAPIGSSAWHDVNEGTIDITQPYRVELPSGKSISVFFYHGSLSQAVAFERLLRDGGTFWDRVKDECRPGLLSLATDGETYGHHFTFGEMALAFMLMKAEDEPDITLTNYAAYLASHPPRQQVRLHEPSSWSCVHGVERWKSDCGCHTGGHHGWNQRWREPLRKAQDAMRNRIHSHFQTASAGLFKDSGKALRAFGAVRFGGRPHDEFAGEHLASGLSSENRDKAWDLLEMEQWSLASMASCSWFFDDLDRIEPLNAMTYATRALELARATGLADDPAHDPEDMYLNILQEGVANGAPQLNGKELYLQRVLPRRESPESIISQALLTLWVRGRIGMPNADTTAHWPGVSVHVTFRDAPGTLNAAGTATISRSGGRQSTYSWVWERSTSERPLECKVELIDASGATTASFTPANLPWNKKQALSLVWMNALEGKSWKRQLLRVLPGLHLIQPWTESQATQNAAWQWGRYWSVLAWAAITAEGAIPENLTDFLASYEAGDSDRQAFATRLIAEVMAKLSGNTPDCRKAAEILQKGKEIYSALDVWQVQNKVWLLDTRHEGLGELADIVGFAPGIKD